MGEKDREGTQGHKVTNYLALSPTDVGSEGYRNGAGALCLLKSRALCKALNEAKFLICAPRVGFKRPNAQQAVQGTDRKTDRQTDRERE